MSEHARGVMSLFRLVPGLRTVRSYRREWLAKDVVAGLVLTALLVPQGMAYAELAGLPPITGLYTSILCLIGYAVFGPSRILVLGPDSVARADDRGDDPAAGRRRRRPGAGHRAGLDAGAAGRRDHDPRPAWPSSGFIADLLSKPTQIGYMNGLALTILVGQLPKLFGFSVTPTADRRDRGFVKGLVHGETVRRRGLVGIAGLVADPGAPALAAEGPGGADRCGAVDRRGGGRSTWPITAS